MALKIWCYVLVMLSLQQIISARDCFDIENIKDCNSCFRCGGHWCNSDSEAIRCKSSPSAKWCARDREEVSAVELTHPGSNIYKETTARVGDVTTIDIVHKKLDPKTVEISSKKSSQDSDFTVTTNTKCDSLNCTTSIHTRPGQEFCYTDGTVSEFLMVTLKVGDSVEDVTVKYNVPCSCKCSEKVEKKSLKCNGRGDYSCGTCSCHNEWEGNSCETYQCPEKRGDVPTPCINPERPHMMCSGNGYCGECESCICFTNMTGYQYFNDLYCSDVCMDANSCEDCWKEPTLGICDKCSSMIPMNFLLLNETAAMEKDNSNRSIWVKCVDSQPDSCQKEYMAMVEDDLMIHVMVTDFCLASADEAKSGAVKLKVPIILVILALVVAAAATVAYFVYKNRTMPLQTNTSTYVSIESGDVKGISPCFKPAVTSYPNPTYGKFSEPRI